MVKRLGFFGKSNRSSIFAGMDYSSLDTGGRDSATMSAARKVDYVKIIVSMMPQIRIIAILYGLRR